MHSVDPPPTEKLSAAPHGHLPPWREADLPEPLPFSLVNAFRTIGPGAILLAAAIGGGEWIIGPRMMLQYGPSILWVATLAIFLQVIFNLEAVRYTLYTGEPTLTGVMRLSPGPKLWAPFYILLGIAQLATPALAVACANALFSAWSRGMPRDEDLPTVHHIGTAIVLGTVVLLLCGKSIEKVLERLSWMMVAFIFVFLIFVNAYFVPVATTARTLGGFLVPRPLPANINLILLASFAATAGSGGLGNLVISSWFRDKGFGMGGRMGAIGGVLAGEKQLEPVGYVFPITPENLRRWGTWWSYTRLDQVALWGMGCFLGMFLNVNLVAAISQGKIPVDAQAGVFQAEHMAQHLGSAFWVLALMNGFWILFSTHLGNTDCLVRTICDILWSAYPRVRQWPTGRIYAVILCVLTAWGLVAMRFGNVIQLFTVLAVVANPILAIAGAQILIVNLTLLPKALRPPLWRCLALGLCVLVYTGFTITAGYDLTQRWLKSRTAATARP